MEANRRVDTKPELALRSLLHRRGLRFRKDYRIDANGLRVRPDIVFTRARVAVFVDGCFWHHCPEHGEMPKANRSYWEEKFRRNTERDRLVDRELRGAGWTVLRFWEHDDPEQAAATVAVTVSARGAVVAQAHPDDLRDPSA